MSKTPSILIKDVPESVYNVILDKQTELKKKSRSLNLSQVVNLLIEEAYVKAKK